MTITEPNTRRPSKSGWPNKLRSSRMQPVSYPTVAKPGRAREVETASDINKWLSSPEPFKSPELLADLKK